MDIRFSLWPFVITFATIRIPASKKFYAPDATVVSLRSDRTRQPEVEGLVT
jgi:hypothetical protein